MDIPPTSEERPFQFFNDDFIAYIFALLHTFLKAMVSRTLLMFPYFFMSQSIEDSKS